LSVIRARLGIASGRSGHYALNKRACGTEKVTAGKSMFFEAGVVKDKKKKNQDKTREERLNPLRGRARRRGRVAMFFQLNFTAGK
jgi:hypothetical protein